MTGGEKRKNEDIGREKTRGRKKRKEKQLKIGK